MAEDRGGIDGPGDRPEDPEGSGREAEVLRARRDSLERLRAKGIEPFAIAFDQIDHAAELQSAHADLGADQTTGERVTVAGRVVLARRHGRLTFFTVRDRTGDIQLFCSADELGDAYWLTDEVDLGDIVGVTGPLMRTKRGELSIRVQELTILTKALRPLPEKWHGLKDPDLQQRRRYLHLIADPAPRFSAEARAKVLRTRRTTTRSTPT
jgi:lysyl-tRNA synthetase, class II